MAESGSVEEPRADTQEQIEDLKHRLLIGQVSSFFRKFYRENGREFPWRQRGVPAFGILAAEMLLRQTRAEQVAAAWPILMERYPSPADLAAADLADLYTLLAPLGLGRHRSPAGRSVDLRECRTGDPSPGQGSEIDRCAGGHTSPRPVFRPCDRLLRLRSTGAGRRHQCASSPVPSLRGNLLAGQPASTSGLGPGREYLAFEGFNPGAQLRVARLRGHDLQAWTASLPCVPAKRALPLVLGERLGQA